MHVEPIQPTKEQIDEIIASVNETTTPDDAFNLKFALDNLSCVINELSTVDNAINLDFDKIVAKLRRVRSVIESLDCITAVKVKDYIERSKNG